ncbi:MAG: twin-arginine translocation signal domain-containing protein [Candidatus Acidiferrales bacterium]
MSNEENKATAISRRDFARRAAIAAATAACLPGELLASHPAAPASPPPQQAEEKLSAESQAEVDAKIQAIFRKYGDRLSDAQKADIRRLVTESQKPLEIMRKFPLDNADQPGNVLKLYPDFRPRD